MDLLNTLISALVKKELAAVTPIQPSEDTTAEEIAVENIKRLVEGKRPETLINTGVTRNEKYIIALVLGMIFFALSLKYSRGLIEKVIGTNELGTTVICTIIFVIILLLLMH